MSPHLKGELFFVGLFIAKKTLSSVLSHTAYGFSVLSTGSRTDDRISDVPEIVTK